MVTMRCGRSLLFLDATGSEAMTYCGRDAGHRGLHRATGEGTDLERSVPWRLTWGTEVAEGRQPLFELRRTG